METRSPFCNRDKIVILKIIMSPCLVNLNDGDKIPIVIFFEWGQDRNYKNHLVSMLSKYFWWRPDLHCDVFLNGDKIVILKIILSPCLVDILRETRSPYFLHINFRTRSPYFLNINMRTWSPSVFSPNRKILSLHFVNSRVETLSPLNYLLNEGIMSLEIISLSGMGTRNHSLQSP